jgi:subfamily B ATP-binding cassette protein MsbA
LRRSFTVAQQGMADVSHAVNEAVSGVKVVQSFGMERYEVERFGRALGAMLRAELRAGRTTSLLPALIELIGAVLGAGLFYLAGLEIARGRLDPGDFTVVLFCLGLLFVSIRRLNSVYAELQRALAAAERVFDMLDREREIRDRPGAAALASFAREIRFEHVDFSYGDETVLHGIELTLARGEVVALVGASGSGKSTLASLLPRFYDPSRGRITIDGHDLRDVTLQSLREQIGLVTQETVVFDDSARNNIAYGRADCALEQVIAAARAAYAHEFIERLPQGYDTVLGERGMRLSMGQRQRITIARALLKDPPLLILDEATSALDAESEAVVQQALETLMRGRTSLVIAHRLATVRRADRIVVLDGGRIVEQGRHGELLARGGTYARLYELQFEEDAAPRDVER